MFVCFACLLACLPACLLACLLAYLLAYLLGLVGVVGLVLRFVPSFSHFVKPLRFFVAVAFTLSIDTPEPSEVLILFFSQKVQLLQEHLPILRKAHLGGRSLNEESFSLRFLISGLECL